MAISVETRGERSARGLSHIIASIRERLERRRRVRETIRALENMSDRELNDIGVSRIDIDRVARDSA